MKVADRNMCQAGRTLMSLLKSTLSSKPVMATGVDPKGAVSSALPRRCVNWRPAVASISCWQVVHLPVPESAFRGKAEELPGVWARTVADSFRVGLLEGSYESDQGFYLG